MPKHPIKKHQNETITVELYEDNGSQWVWLGTETGSGAKYEVKTYEELGKVVADYVRFYVAGEA